MPSMDSPLVNLGALWLAGQSQRGRRYTGGESGKGLVAGGFGGASAEWAGQQVQSVTGSTITDELSQALAGALISRAGEFDAVPSWAANGMARGIHYNVATQSMQEMGVGAGELLGDITGGGGGGNGGSQAFEPSQSFDTARSTSGTTF